MNIKDLSLDDLSLYLSLQVFLCDVDLLNYKDLYEQMDKLDDNNFVSSDFAVWAPFEIYEHHELMYQIDTHQDSFLRNLKEYVNPDSK